MNNIEILSPAGNIDSFIEAYISGANSIYLGLKKFNARRAALNFSIYQLKKVINLAHSKNIKIYLTLNIDLKSNELYEAIQILELAKNINIDAVIVKDPAIIYIINKFFKNEINIHLSTQNFITSSYGVKFAEKINAKRVILARELTKDEIKICCQNKNVECEIFVEGSMCFSISGKCLASSYIGSKSGNRGACVAPCRVMWESDSLKKNFFSMKDLSLFDNLEDIKKIGVKALKIEGRLKKNNWVGIVTRLYNKYLNNNFNEIESLKNQLQKYSARELSNGHFINHNDLTGENENWTNYEKQIYSENKYNDLLSIFNNNINIIIEIYNNIKIEIILNDLKTIILFEIPKNPKKAKTIDFTNIKTYLIDYLIKNFDLKEQNIKIQINKNIEISSSNLNKIYNEIVSNIKKLYIEQEKLPDLPDNIIEFIKPQIINKKRKRIIGELPNKVIVKPDQLNLIKNFFDIDTIVIQLSENFDFNNIKKFLNNYKIILSLPEILFETEANKMFYYIKELKNYGFNDFEANSFCGVEILLNIESNKYLGPGFGLYNHLSTQLFKKSGFNSFYPSIESDLSMLKSFANFIEDEINIIVFSKIALFISRVESKYFNNNKIFKDKFIEIECIKDNNLNYFVSKNPFSLIGKKFKQENIGFDNLTIDLRFFNNPQQILNEIFIVKKEFENYDSFNFFKKLY